MGALWENFLVSERQKYLHYHQQWVRTIFWRTYQQGIDYIEESDGSFRAFEFKWNPNAKARFSQTFLQSYSPAQTDILHGDNFEPFVGI
ncbi:hypothetical protein GCM10023187_55380 [Nibrella viscosa]|uniref:DUF4143 domain-containing protein n=1 Tax=Nibrella viscosa TaxID=1084524 RepID=A0ABP8L1D9_9BACT